MVGGESQADGASYITYFQRHFFLRATVGGYNKIGAENEQVDNTKPRSVEPFHVSRQAQVLIIHHR